jgi:chemotaxis protein MotB
MAKAPCKCKPTECEECPEWIFTFADLVMLMMGFFVILWVLKPEGKEGAAADAKAAQQQLVALEGEIRSGFGYEPDPTSKDPVDKEMIMGQMRSRARNGPGERGKTTQEKKGTQGVENEVTTIRLSKQATLGGRLLFKPGSSELQPEMTAGLAEIADLIRGHRNVVMIKGHSGFDDLPEGATDQQKMDLSLKRAQHVADYLVSKGVTAEVMRVQGCSTFEPVVQRAYTTEGRASNRRVEVEATASLVESFQDIPTTSPAMLESPGNP